jgi:hypothetical protein
MKDLGRLDDFTRDKLVCVSSRINVKFYNDAKAILANGDPFGVDSRRTELFYLMGNPG